MTRALRASLDSGRSIDLVLNLHNEESGESLDTAIDDEKVGAAVRLEAVPGRGLASDDPVQVDGELLAGARLRQVERERRDAELRGGRAQQR